MHIQPHFNSKRQSQFMLCIEILYLFDIYINIYLYQYVDTAEPICNTNMPVCAVSNYHSKLYDAKCFNDLTAQAVLNVCLLWQVVDIGGDYHIMKETGIFRLNDHRSFI